MGLKVKEAGVFVDVGSGGGTTPVLVDDWVRPIAWPAMPTVLASEQKIVGLYAVWPGDGTGTGGNFFAFNAQGAYTINLGDGTTTNFASNTQANHEFDFNNAALAGTNKPVIFTAATNTISLTGHGFPAGAITQFYNIVSTTGVVKNRRYYVVNPTANSFQVSATLGGSPIALTNDGSATLLPYKVAVVTITPQAGQNLTVVNFQAKNPATNLQAYTTGWLELAISIPNVNGSSFALGGTTVGHRLAQRVNVIACGALSTMANMYNGFIALASLAPFPSSISGVVSMANKYQNCVALKRFPPYTGSAASLTTTSGKYANCQSGEDFPTLPVSTAALLNTSSMYLNCQLARDLPNLPTTAQIANLGSMYSGCVLLQVLPVHNMSGVSSSGNANNFVDGCVSLSRAAISGMRFSFNISSRKLSAVALNEVFTGLPTVTGQTITVTGNYGINQPGYNASIATAKGWTVTA